MARISFSPLVEEIIGKLAGSVFQDSYGGFQVRTRVSPRNPQTQYQQLRRGEFGFLSASWRGLTPVQKQTFIDNATSPGAALNLFLQTNVNLTLIEEPTITTYVPSADPGTMQIEFETAEEGSLTVKATGSPPVVPAGTKLLLQVTYQKEPTKMFTNPSQYSPVISFDEGTDLSIPVSILTEWQNRYGVMLPEKRFCLSSALIDKSNGHRGDTLINCTTVEQMPKFTRLFTNVTPAATSGTGAANVFSFTIPANTFTQDGDTLDCYIHTTNSGSITNATINFQINNSTHVGHQQTSVVGGQYRARVTRVASDTLEIVMYGFLFATVGVTNSATLTGLDFTTTITTRWQIQAPISGTITARLGYINKELV